MGNDLFYASKAGVAPVPEKWLDTQISGSGAGKLARHPHISGSNAEIQPSNSKPGRKNATEMHDVSGILFGAIRTCSGFGWLNNLLISY